MKKTGIRISLPRFICMVLIVAMALCMGACGSVATTAAPVELTTIEEGGVYGEGSKEFTLVVADEDGKEVTATVKTDETMVGIALQKLGLLAGEMHSYGLYVETVNNITLEYGKGTHYWAFYIDGEYAMTGVDTTEITEGETYQLVYTK